MSYRDLVYTVYMKLPNTDTSHLDKWCNDHFGEQGILWDSYYVDASPHNFDQYYAFSNHEDAMLFTLTWQ